MAGFLDFLGGIGSGISSGWDKVLGAFSSPSVASAAPLDYARYEPTTMPAASDPMGELQTPMALDYARVGEGVSPAQVSGGGGGGGWEAILNKVGGAAKSVLPLAQIGAAAGGGITNYMAMQDASKQNAMALRQQKNQEQLTRQAAQGAATPLTTFGQAELDASLQGKIPEQIQAKIDLWKQGALTRMRDYLARAGLGDSQSLQQMESLIDQQAQAMAADFLMQQQQQGIGAITAGGSLLTGAAGQAGAAAQQAGAGAASIDNLIAQGEQSLNRLLGASS